MNKIYVHLLTLLLCLTCIHLVTIVLSLILLHHKYIRSSRYLGKSTKFRGAVVLVKKHTLMGMTDLKASIMDRVYEIFGKRVSFQLVSATVGDPNDRGVGRTGKPAYIEDWVTKISSIYADEYQFNIQFDWEESYGVPGAVIVRNFHPYEFYLKTLTVNGLPQKNHLHFECNSWVYPAFRYSNDRIFFNNDTYLPKDTPEPLKPYREDELRVLRGNSTFGKLWEHDRIYDYDVYNDLGDPLKGPKFERPVLGGSDELPYPRRARSGRPLSNGDYIPCDEYFNHAKFSDFIAFKLKSDMESSVKSKGVEEFKSINDVMKLYKGPMEMPGMVSKIINLVPFEMIKELLRTDGERLLSFPLPQVISNDEKRYWWATDKEFARQMLAGLHPVLIRAAKEEEVHSFINHNKMEKYKEDDDEDVNDWVFPTLTEEEENNIADEITRFFILDHSYLKVYIDKIYKASSNKVYATKTLLYLEKDGTLSPRGIMLIESIGNQQFAYKYYFPSVGGIHGALWMLAKSFVIVNDSGYHQLISHWLHSHAVIEPFIIAAKRQLSVMHPIHKLLTPHFRDTINMNSLSRQILIHANGAIERNFFPGKYALSLSSKIYKNWNFMDHALPTDLCNRGMAVKEGDKLRLSIEDYPYATDGLEIWNAIKTWVIDYCSIYYSNDTSIQTDLELQSWWHEIRYVGHGDLKDRSWWPKMESLEDLIESCTIIIWLSSAYHAALNFGQYAYAGFVPNRPTLTRRAMPEPEEYDALMKDPYGFLLKTITSKEQAISVMGVIEILSRHSSDEVYIGQRDDGEWASDRLVLDGFKRFRDRLVEIEKNVEMRNLDEGLKNRKGMVGVPYTLLYPNTSDCSRKAGLTGKGIPNSVSI